MYLSDPQRAYSREFIREVWRRRRTGEHVDLRYYAQGKYPGHSTDPVFKDRVDADRLRRFANSPRAVPTDSYTPRAAGAGYDTHVRQHSPCHVCGGGRSVTSSADGAVTSIGCVC